MTDGDVLLRAICANPADDFPRLQYADWLEEHGQSRQEKARAEFIRLQIELLQVREKVRQNMPEDDWLYTKERDLPLERLQDLEERESKLIEGYGYYWVNDPQVWPVSMAMGGSECGQFSRGFVNRVECPLADWLQHGPAIVLAQPVTEVRLTDSRPLVNGWWCGSKTLVSKDELPRGIFDLLENCESERMRINGTYSMKRYASPEAAHAALSVAAVSWARRQAGLPDLPTATP